MESHLPGLRELQISYVYSAAILGRPKKFATPTHHAFSFFLPIPFVFQRSIPGAITARGPPKAASGIRT